MTVFQTLVAVKRFFCAALAETDPQPAATIGSEMKRQQDQIELITSENIVSCAVPETQNSVLTSKYAEGYPRQREYGGCKFVDQAEFHHIGALIVEVLDGLVTNGHSGNGLIEAGVKRRVQALCARNPIYA